MYNLGTYSIEPRSLTVSGISSGAFFSVQFQYAHSSRVKGAGIVAGGPFYSALGNSITAQEVIKHPSLIVPRALHTFAEECALVGQIDSLQYLKNHNVYVYSGVNDSVVIPGVADKLIEMYKMAGVTNIHSVLDLQSEHGMPTLSHGVNCVQHLSPYILKCNYSAAGNLLKTLYGNGLAAPTSEDDWIEKNLIKFNQKEFLPAIGGQYIGLHDVAYAYIPTSCQNGAECKLHFNFHGCLQSSTFIGEEYIRTNGFNAWAEKNNIIVIYPQTKKSEIPLNMYGCYDWWGAFSPLYYSKVGPQIYTISKIISRISGYDFETSNYFKWEN